MKRFAFSLERMRSYKDQMLESEKNVLLTLRGQKHQLEKRREGLQEDFQQLNRRLQAEVRKGVAVHTLRLYDFQLDTTRRQIDGLLEEEEVLSTAVEQQLAVVVGLSQEVSGLDKLEEKQREEYDRMVMKAEEVFLDEIITSKLNRS